MENKNIYIAKTYSELQGLPDLEKASNSFVTERCSGWGLIKLILQTTEIGIQNLNDLFARLATDLDHDDVKKVVVKVGWIKDITTLTAKLSGLNKTIVNEKLKDRAEKLLVAPSLEKLQSLYKHCDSAVFSYLEKKSIKLTDVLGKSSEYPELYRFLHDYRILAHELAVIDSNIRELSVPEGVNYSDFIGLAHIHAAIENPELPGDTFFKQFRCLHQIPELLTFEVNGRLEYAIACLRDVKNVSAHFHLRIANELMLITLDSMRPIVNNLAHDDYHQIRENLGLTSGSHSVNIHYHLFRDLYVQITGEFVKRFFIDEANYQAALNQDYIVKLLESELLKLRATINQWRVMHLHLPRTNLGENKTKSLIGSPEAVEAARKMQRIAAERDPLNVIGSLYSPVLSEVRTDLKDYIDSDESFDHYLGSCLGNVTQDRFKSVQNREGIFSQTVFIEKPSSKK